MEDSTDRSAVPWKAIRETGGFFAVVLSLVFVGYEIQQNTAAAEGQTRQELAALNQEWLILLTTDDEFSDLYIRAWIEEDGVVAPEEEQKASWIKLLDLRRQENVFFQVQADLLDESALHSYGLQFFPRQLERERFRRWWVDQRFRESFHPDFVRYLESLQ